MATKKKTVKIDGKTIAVGDRILYKPNTAGGSRYNSGKPKLSYILEFKNALNGLAHIFEVGAKKYSRGNCRMGLDHTELVDSLARHLSDYMAGENTSIEVIDGVEYELSLVDRVLWNALLLSEMTRTHPELDTRPIIKGAVQPHAKIGAKNGVYIVTRVGGRLVRTRK